MSRTELNQLRNRWSQAKIRRVVRYLKASDNEALAGCLHDVDGAEYVDLRGIQPSFRFMDLKTKNVDFSHSIYQGEAGFGRVNIKNSLFVGVNLMDGGNLSDIFIECDFSHARMKGILCIDGTSFSKCNFLEADMSYARFWGVKFSDCNFTSANLRRTEFYDCELRGCRFLNSNFNDSAIGGTKFFGLQESFIWKDGDTEKLCEFCPRASQGTIDLRRAFVAEVTFE